MNGFIYRCETGHIARIFAEEIAIEEAKRCKTADDDSDDEDETDGYPGNGIKGIAQAF